MWSKKKGKLTIKCVAEHTHTQLVCFMQFGLLVLYYSMYCTWGSGRVRRVLESERKKNEESLLSFFFLFICLKIPLVFVIQHV